MYIQTLGQQDIMNGPVLADQSTLGPRRLCRAKEEDMTRWHACPREYTLYVTKLIFSWNVIGMNVCCTVSE